MGSDYQGSTVFVCRFGNLQSHCYTEHSRKNIWLYLLMSVDTIAICVFSFLTGTTDVLASYSFSIHAL
jgi:hypothetical protein